MILSKIYAFKSRNKFHFSEVHGSMTATDHVQSKWRPKGLTLALHGTRCVHTSMNLRKMKFISYIYTLFYIFFVHYLWNFDLNLANKRRRCYHPTCLVITFNSRHHDMTSCRPINYCIYLWHRLRVTSRERVSFMRVWTSSVQNRFI